MTRGLAQEILGIKIGRGWQSASGSACVLVWCCLFPGHPALAAVVLPSVVLPACRELIFVCVGRLSQQVGSWAQLSLLCRRGAASR